MVLGNMCVCVCVFGRVEGACCKIQIFSTLTKEIVIYTWLSGHTFIRYHYYYYYYYYYYIFLYYFFIFPIHTVWNIIYIHTHFFIGFDRCRRTPSAVCEKCPWRYRVDRTDYQDINYPAKHMRIHTHTPLAEESCKDLLSRYSLPLSMISVGELKLVQIPTDKKKIIIMVIIKKQRTQYFSCKTIQSWCNKLILNSVWIYC